MARFSRSPHDPDDNDESLASLFGAADHGRDDDHDVDVDDDPDAYEPAYPPVAPPSPRPASDLPDPRQAPPSWDIPELSMPIPPRPETTRRDPSTAIPPDGGSFFWGLTPNDEPDPILHGDEPQDADAPVPPPAETGYRGHPLVPPTVPLAPYVPPVYEEPPIPQAAPPAPTPPAAPVAPPTVVPSAAEPPPAAVPPFVPPAAVVPPTPPASPEPEPPFPAGIAVPSWSPTPTAPPQAPPPFEPPGETASVPLAAGEPEHPWQRTEGTPDAVHPATVELPWLRRSRRSASPDDDDATTEWGQPQNPTAQDATAQDAAAQGAVAQGGLGESQWGWPGETSVPAAEPFPPARQHEPFPPTQQPEPYAPVQQQPAEVSSWSLFGDLFDDEQQPQAESDEPERPAAAQAEPFGPASSDPGAEHAATTDIFAAFNAAAAAAGLSGLSAGEAAAYDLPNESASEPVGPWGQPAATGGAVPPGQSGPADPIGPAGPPASGAAFGVAPASRASVPPQNARSARAMGAGGHARSAGGPTSGGPGAGGPGRGGGRGSDGSSHDSDDGGPSPRAQRIMLIVAGALLLVLLFIALFIVGRTVAHPDAPPTPTPTATKTATPTPTPTPTAVATGPVAPGKHPWNALRGGECLQPFTTPWADTFTVVDCATPHAGQLVYSARLSTDAAAPFPGADAVAAQASALCARAGILNLDAAAKYGDAQLQASYPVTDEQWKQGQRSYYCFVNRSSGQPISGSLMGSGPK